jgi:hypothetical protein
MAGTDRSGVARRSFLGRGAALGLAGAAAGVIANIEQLIAAEGSASGAGFASYMAHDQGRAQSLLTFMNQRGFTERPEFSVNAQGTHVDVWGRGTLSFDTVQTIMASDNGSFAVLIGQGTTSPTPGPPNAQVWVIPNGGSARTSSGGGPSPAAVYVANDNGVQQVPQ